MAHLRDRRAFGNIGTRKFRGARFGDPLSPRVSPFAIIFNGQPLVFNGTNLTYNG